MHCTIYPPEYRGDPPRRIEHYPTMLQAGAAKRVTIHLNEDTASPRDFLYVDVFQFLWKRGIAGASLIRPQAGFGSHHRVHDAADPGTKEHMPVRIDFIESPSKVDAILPDLARLVTDGLIEVQDCTIYQSLAGEQH